MPRTRPRDPALRFEQISGFLIHLPPETLRQLVRWHAAQATLLREREAELLDRAKMGRRVKRQLEEVRASFPVDPRAARDLEIMRLARRGWSNSMIGTRMKLHPVTVSKIVSRCLERKAPRYVPQRRRVRIETDEPETGEAVGHSTPNAGRQETIT